MRKLLVFALLGICAAGSFAEIYEVKKGLMGTGAELAPAPMTVIRRVPSAVLAGATLATVKANISLGPKGGWPVNDMPIVFSIHEKVKDQYKLIFSSAGILPSKQGAVLSISASLAKGKDYSLSAAGVLQAYGKGTLYSVSQFISDLKGYQIIELDLEPQIVR